MVTFRGIDFRELSLSFSSILSTIYIKLISLILFIWCFRSCTFTCVIMDVSSQLTLFTFWVNSCWNCYICFILLLRCTLRIKRSWPCYSFSNWCRCPLHFPLPIGNFWWDFFDSYFLIWNSFIDSSWSFILPRNRLLLLINDYKNASSLKNNR